MSIWDIDEIILVIFHQLSHYQDIIFLRWVSKRYHRVGKEIPILEQKVEEDTEKRYRRVSYIRGTDLRHGETTIFCYQSSTPRWIVKDYYWGELQYRKVYTEYIYGNQIQRVTVYTPNNHLGVEWEEEFLYKEGVFLIPQMIMWGKSQRIWTQYLTNKAKKRYSYKQLEDDNGLPIYHTWYFDHLEMGIDYLETLPSRSCDEDSSFYL